MSEKPSDAVERAEDDALRDFADSLRELNTETRQFVREHTSFRRRFMAGIGQGFGIVIGSTLLVSMMVWLLRPLTSVEFLGPMLDRFITSIESGPERRSAGTNAIVQDSISEVGDGLGNGATTEEAETERTDDGNADAESREQGLTDQIDPPPSDPLDEPLPGPGRMDQLEELPASPPNSSDPGS